MTIDINQIARMSHRAFTRVLPAATACLLALLLMVSHSAHAQQAPVGNPGSGTSGTVVTTIPRLNARSGPATTFPIVGKLPAGSSLTIVGSNETGDWLRVTASDLTGEGWVSSAFVVPGSPATTAPATTAPATTAPATTAPATTAPATATPATTEPATTAPAPAEASAGSRTTAAPASGLLGAARGSVGRAVSAAITTRTVTTATVTNATTAVTVTTATTTVAMAAPAAQTTTDAAPQAAAPAPAPVTAEVLDPTAITQPANMNVRGGPGTGFARVGTAPAGTRLKISGVTPAGDWYRITQADGSEGWVSVSLVRTIGPVETITKLTEADLPAPPAAPAAAAPAAPAPAAPAVSAPPPSGAMPFGYGIQAHMVHTNDDMIAKVMDMTRNMGFNWVKQQIEWKLFENTQGQLEFGAMDAIVNAANARGINLLFSIVNAPPWAREPGFDGSVGGPPADPNTYAAFVGAVAGKYCNSSVKAIEVWNEQNLHYEWGNKPLNPGEYVQLLAVSYAAIKNACPSMYVISGAPTPAGNNPPYAMDDFTYLEEMFKAGANNYLDAVGSHPSGFNVPPSHTWETACEAIRVSGNSFNGACDSPHHSWSFRSTMEGYRNIMNVYGAGNKSVVPTEFGWAAGGAFDPRYAYANDNSMEEQAAWTVEAYQMMKNWGWVGPAILWNLNFRVVANGTEKAQWGIVGHNWEPLSTYNALAAMPK